MSIALRGAGARADRGGVSSKGGESTKQVPRQCNRICPDALIELAQSELGFAPSSMALCELCWAVAAHCSARGHAGDWHRIEVPGFLDALERAYAKDDLIEMLSRWVALIFWLPEVGLLQEGVQRAYVEQTQSWLMQRVRLGQALESLLMNWGAHRPGE